jgi:tRNA threonylcarbamoyl adenosine modification protein YeaZ
MKILALEFSTSQRAVAVCDGAKPIAQVVTDDLKTGPLLLIDEVLGNGRIDRAEISVIAIGIGPGSYTGIRSAIALAQGWQLAKSVNLSPISSAEILAATARTQGQRGETHLIIDAQRHEHYHTTWNLTETEQTETKPLSIIGVVEAFELESFGPDQPGMRYCKPLHPCAVQLAKLAANRNFDVPGFAIEPIYLRQTEFVKAAPTRKL